MKPGMSLIVKTITRITIGLVFLFGLYIVAHGHLTPGGGFAGGVILALVFILFVLSYGREFAVKTINETWSGVLESLGAIMFVSIALLGFVGGYFFFNFLPKGEAGNIISAGAIPLSNLAIMFKVGAGLFAVFLVLIAIKLEVKE